MNEIEIKTKEEEDEGQKMPKTKEERKKQYEEQKRERERKEKAETREAMKYPFDKGEARASVNWCHEHIKSDAKEMLIYALRAGTILLRMKRELPHGEFLPWLKNTDVPERTARRYMDLASNEGELKTATVSDLAEAYDLLKDVRERKKIMREEEERIAVHSSWNRKRKRREERREQRLAGKPPDDWTKEEEENVQGWIAWTARWKEEKDAFRQRRKTGEKPANWKKEWDNAWDEKYDKDAYQERILNGFFGIRTHSFTLADPDTDKEQTIIFEVIEDYLEKMTDDNRRLEAIHNLIRKLKRLGTACQKEIAEVNKN